jgi:hypothetical protein
MAVNPLSDEGCFAFLRGFLPFPGWVLGAGIRQALPLAPGSGNFSLANSICP